MGRQCFCENSRDEHQAPNLPALVERLADREIKLNVTAIMTLAQWKERCGPEFRYPELRIRFRRPYRRHRKRSYATDEKAVELLKANANAELVWATCARYSIFFRPTRSAVK